MYRYTHMYHLPSVAYVSYDTGRKDGMYLVPGTSCCKDKYLVLVPWYQVPGPPSGWYR